MINILFFFGIIFPNVHMDWKSERKLKSIVWMDWFKPSCWLLVLSIKLEPINLNLFIHSMCVLVFITIFNIDFCGYKFGSNTPKKELEPNQIALTEELISAILPVSILAIGIPVFIFIYFISLKYPREMVVG